MTDKDAVPGTFPAAIDYERMYRGEELSPGVAVQRPPWDIGRPQPLLVEFERRGRIHDDVLDVGCGPGDNAIYLAGLGYRVIGLDVAATAIGAARSRAAKQGVPVSFETADATLLVGHDGRFYTVVSSALLHCLAPEQRRAHVAALTRVIKPGGRLIQFCFTTTDCAELYAPYPISEETLRSTFAPPNWSITMLRPDRLTVEPDETMSERFARIGFRPELDDQGALLLPVLVLDAQRI
jgi:SAM-dependent methyltransferase